MQNRMMVSKYCGVSTSFLQFSSFRKSVGRESVPGLPDFFQNRYFLRSFLSEFRFDGI